MQNETILMWHCRYMGRQRFNFMLLVLCWLDQEFWELRQGARIGRASLQQPLQPAEQKIWSILHFCRCERPSLKPRTRNTRTLLSQPTCLFLAAAAKKHRIASTK